MVAIFAAYYAVPATRPAFTALSDLRTSTGFAFSFLAAALAGGPLPELLRIAIFQNFRPTRANLTGLLFGSAFWGAMGVLIDAFYRVQSHLFGADPTVAAITAKVLLDMLAFTPFVGVPLASTAYLWKAHGFDNAIFGDVLNLRGYRRHILPVLIPNWAVWGPVVCVIYALPTGLQFPTYVLAQAFWTLVLTTLTTKTTPP
jgi:hypothetical protein